MNAHDFKLFYYVVRGGGISHAARVMPRRLQRQTISEQLLRLEEDYGCQLWDRAMKCPTREGAEVYDRVRPFFDWLDEEQRRRRAPPTLPDPVRIAATDLIHNEYLPGLLHDVQRQRPDLRFAPVPLREAEMAAQWQSGKLHLVIGPAMAVPAGTERLPIARVPLALLVPATSPLKTAAQCLAAHHPLPALVCPDVDSAVGRLFREGLARHGIEWPVAISTHSIAAVDRHVTKANDVGVTVHVSVVERPGVRLLPLKDFGEVEVVAAWDRNLTRPLQPILDVLARHAEEFRRKNRKAA